MEMFVVYILLLPAALLQSTEGFFVGISEGESTILRCASGPYTLSITAAYYGRSSNVKVPLNCRDGGPLPFVQSLCNGKHSCYLGSSWFSLGHCYGLIKYLGVQYTCKIDGGWSSWGGYTPCSVTCTTTGNPHTGIKTRHRNCTDPAPRSGGKECSGVDSQVMTCSTSTDCPIDGGWSSWGSYTPCSVTCTTTGNPHTGIKTRHRTCTDPAPRSGGKECSGVGSQITACSISTDCPNIGTWGTWSNWGQCSSKCGNGTQSRTRSCDHKIPDDDQAQCQGSSTEFQNCTAEDCSKQQNGEESNQCHDGWFTCKSGNVKCIKESLTCDCRKDCEDGSDESNGYGNCSTRHEDACASGTERIAWSAWSVLTSVITILLPVVIYK